MRVHPYPSIYPSSAFSAESAFLGKAEKIRSLRDLRGLIHLGRGLDNIRNAAVFCCKTRSTCYTRNRIHSLLLLRPQELQLSPGDRPNHVLWKRAWSSAFPRALRCALARLLLQASDECAQR